MFERLVALHVTDDRRYQEYRAAIAPILHQHGGGFRYDFRVSETLTSQADHKINRVFTVFFPDRAKSEAFFAEPRYRTIRDTYFAPSVAGSTVLAEYELA